MAQMKGDVLLKRVGMFGNMTKQLNMGLILRLNTRVKKCYSMRFLICIFTATAGLSAGAAWADV
jgi:hypothetical protein